jgi:riboflavin synthase
MFTGLIEAIGVLEEVEKVGDARRLRIGVGDENFLREAHVGDSIAVGGVCLTTTEYSGHNFSVSAVEETLRRTTLGTLEIGDRVNLERALRADARLGGHIVQGHVDGVGAIVGIREEGEGWWVSFEPPFDLMKHIVEKGSICIDGISLTVANVAYARFSVALIPHTRAVTTAQEWQIGKTVNLEVDIIAKYVERLMAWNKTEA